jgi:hypothetical protein
MRTIFKIIASTALLLALNAAWQPVFAQYAATPDEDIYRGSDRRYGHLEYFGFYASAMGNWNFTQELAPFTNLTWIHVGNPDRRKGAIKQMIGRLEEARAAGVDAVLSLEPFLFENLQGKPRTDQEIEDFLVELRVHIEESGVLDTLVMIYPKDEPFRNFRHHRDPNFREQYISGEVYSDIYRDLSHVNELISRVFPEKKIGVILSGNELDHAFFSIPENYDWVGFDCYENLFHACEGRSFVQLYDHLLDHMQPHQKLMAVPQTWVDNGHKNQANWPDVLLQRFRQHYELALAEPRFVAFIPFIWSFDSDSKTPGVGFNRFPELFDDGTRDRGSYFVDQVKKVGTQVKNGKHRYPNMAYRTTENHPDRPDSEIRGEVLSVSKGGMVSAWAINNALAHKNLRVRLRVLDTKGAVQHETGFQRTFIKARDPSPAWYLGAHPVGVHGHRFRIPRQLIRDHHGENFEIEFNIYGDGKKTDPVVSHYITFIVGEETMVSE